MHVPDTPPPADVYPGNILISLPGMHEMAERIMELLPANSRLFTHLRADCTRFANGELKPQIMETVRGSHVFLLAGLQEPDPNNALMLMLLTADALKRASVCGITLVLPYMPYLRQDRKDQPRTPISARLVADLIETNARVERVITLDMHADQEQGFFSIPVDNINALQVHAEYFRTMMGNDLDNVVVVAPDFGGAVRARRFARALGTNVPVSIIEKSRPKAGEVEMLNVIGPSVEGRFAIIYDDMIDSGKTNRQAVAEMHRQGALEVWTCVTHGIFSGDAAERFAEAGKPVVATPSIPRTEEYQDANGSWLTFVSIDQLLANAIHEASIVGGSISQFSR